MRLIKYIIIKATKFKLFLRYGRQLNLGKLVFGKYLIFDIKGKNFKVSIGNVMFFDFCSIKIRNGGKIRIDDGVSLNSFSSINCLDSIWIKRNTIIGENVRFYDHNHEYKNQNILIKMQGYNTSPIIVGENCWIGSNVTVLKGVTIGDNSVIGSGVILHKSIPQNSIVRVEQTLNINEIEFN